MSRGSYKKTVREARPLARCVRYGEGYEVWDDDQRLATAVSAADAWRGAHLRLKVRADGEKASGDVQDSCSGEPPESLLPQG